MATGTTPTAKHGNNCSNKQFTLSYEGKESPTSILAHPFNDFAPAAQVSAVGVSSCLQPKQIEIAPNALLYGDNQDALLFLLNNGFANKVGLVYIDPPYATLMDFLNREQKLAYCDTLCGADYLEFLRVRLILLRELFRPVRSAAIIKQHNPCRPDN